MVFRFGRTWLVAVITTLLAIAASGILITRTYRSSAESTLARSLDEVFEHSRPTLGRRVNAPYAAYAPEPASSEALNRAQLLLLTLPRTYRAFDEFKADIEIASHRWKNAATTLEMLVARSPDNPRLTNDLGVCAAEAE